MITIISPRIKKKQIIINTRVQKTTSQQNHPHYVIIHLILTSKNCDKEKSA